MSTKKQIGRIPVSKGEYVAGQTYNRLNQVTMYGSTYQSRVDGNTSAPAIMDSNGNVQHANTDQWLVIADGREAYNAGEKLSCFSLQENEEFLAVETDAEGKILSSTNADGSHYIHNAKSETIPEEFSHIDDPDGRMEITTDSDGKILSYRDSKGILHEEEIHTDKISFGIIGSSEIGRLAERHIRCFDLPKYGTINIRQETFFVTAKDGINGANDIYAIQINEDTEANASSGKNLCKFYLKASLTDNGDGTYSKTPSSIELEFYVPSKVQLLNGKYYVESTLNKSEIDQSYSLSDDSLEVVKITDKPTVECWSIDKKTEHHCLVDIDFGDYLKGTFNIGVKYQGASTLYLRKRNFRFTFYKDGSFSLKNKIKIGEMVRTSGYNLKAYYNDDTILKEASVCRMMIAIWENRRDGYHNYPWRNNKILYDCATGMIKSFPIQLSIGGVFYGLYIYGLKKDGANYHLDKDEDGMFVSGDGGSWSSASPSEWTDELNDEMTESNKLALTTFFSFINSAEFTKENAPEHLSIIDWIDYFIGLQVFMLKDNNYRNQILFSMSDKTCIYPFFYDMDNAYLYGEDGDILKDAWQTDTTLWKNFKTLYWDEICTRYKELRNNVLTEEYIKELFYSLSSSIPDVDYDNESTRWGKICNKIYIKNIYTQFGNRLKYLDTYFV